MWAGAGTSSYLFNSTTKGVDFKIEIRMGVSAIVCYVLVVAEILKARKIIMYMIQKITKKMINHKKK